MQELENALINADAAGDTEGAQVLASEIKRMRGFAGQLQQANEMQSRKMMTHQAEPTKPKDMYSSQAQNQSFGENALAGFGGAMYGLGYLGPKSLVGMDHTGEVADWKASMAGLGTTAGGKIGEFAGYGILPAAATVMTGPNVLGAGLVGGVEGLMLPAESGQERALNTTLGATSGAAGQKLGNTLANASVKRRAIKTLQPDKTLDAVKQETLRKGLDMGYKLPPSAAGKQSLLETIGGQIKTQQTMADANQTVINAAIRKNFGLTNDVPIKSKTMKSIRENAGKVYQSLKMQGRVYLDDAYKGAEQTNTEVLQKNWFGDVGDNQPYQANNYLDAGDVVERMKQLRHDGHERLSAWRSSDGDPELLQQAKDLLSQASELEGLMERHLERRGNGKLLETFRKARQTIAQTYDVQDTILEGAGDVDALKIGALFQMGEKGKGAPLTGELADVGRFASRFPQSTRLRTFETPVNSALDYATAALAASNASSPAGWLAAGLPMLRGPARAMMQRQGFQSKLPMTYAAPNAVERALPYLLDYTPTVGGLPVPISRAVWPGMSVGGLLQPSE